MTHRLTRFLLTVTVISLCFLGFGGVGEAKPNDLALLHNPLAPAIRQTFTPAERASLNTLIQTLNRHRTAAIDTALGGSACGPLQPRDALLTITAPFRTRHPERLEVVLACAGDHGAVTLSFTRSGQRTTYLLPPELNVGGRWRFTGAYTLRDINQDGRRELALVRSGQGYTYDQRSIIVLQFSGSQIQQLGSFDVWQRERLSPTKTTTRASLLWVQKGPAPVLFAQDYALHNGWQKVGFRRVPWQKATVTFLNLETRGEGMGVEGCAEGTACSPSRSRTKWRGPS
ncbi:hypothetical protein ACINK0_05225 [Deinococcus sp. VB343]|uniref:VCBS repeat-containing protein n=1 Tax=Deinococcus sp. VB142 TaxID=3112952 RepID=A0AAU6PZL0_9DEIO